MKKLTILTVLLSLSFFSWDTPKANTKKLKKLLSNNWAYIPAGEAKLGETVQNVNEFYILKTEVSNLDYRTFLKSFNDKNSEEYNSVLPDTTVWSNKISQNQSYVNQYFRYPGFSNYPVVGVSFQNALNYCKWLEGKINAELNEGEKVTIKLPSEIEWIRAARGEKHNQSYPWEGSGLRDKKGGYLANYRKENQHLHAAMIITAETKSYRPNEFGVYQMCGNLAEMLEEPNKVKGGSWNMSANSLKIDEAETVNYPSNNVGFRPVLMMVSK